MANYKKFYIQQVLDGIADYGDIIDTQDRWGIVCQECPFKYLPETKELAKRDWPDEDGSDVYVPNKGLKFKPYEMDVKFLYVGSEANMAANIKQFMDFISGRINIYNNTVISSGAYRKVNLKIYDQYTKTGRQGVFYNKTNNELFFYDDHSAEALARFSVNFFVSDPVTEITLSTSSSSD